MADYSGVYVIENIINGKQYVGSAVNLRKRRREHFWYLRYGKHNNHYFQNAFNFYGEDAFVFKTILVCEKFELLRYEQALIDLLKPEYNICLVAGSRLGMKHSDRAKEKIGQANLGRKPSLEALEKNRLAQLGRKHTEETKEKLKQINLGRKMSPEAIEKNRAARLGSKLSEATKEKLRQANLGKTMSSEAIEKTRQAHLGSRCSEETKEKIKQSKLGKKFSPETREKMRQSALIRWKILRLQDEKE